jgi:ribose transport system ATP-binding protein
MTMNGIGTPEHAGGWLREKTVSAPPARVSALAVSGLSKRFGANLALDNFTIDVAPGEVHALLGENGSGKSTFIKILAGYHVPEDGGTVAIAGQPLDFGSAASAHRIGCRFVHQDLGLVLDLPVLDNLYLGSGFPTTFGTIRRRKARKAVLESLERVGSNIDPETFVSDLSPAQRTAVAVARSLMVEAAGPVRFLVFDEPTATLPEDEVRNLLDIVRRVSANDIGVLYVTHRLDEIFGLAHNVTVLRDGRKVAGRPVEGLTRRDVINLLVGSEFDEAAAASEELAADAHPTRLLVDDLHSATLAGASFEARAHEIVGIAGLTGSGRETILRTTFGDLPRVSGEVRLDDTTIPPGNTVYAVRRGMAYMPPDRKALGAVMALSAIENFLMADVTASWKFPRMMRRDERVQAETWFERLDVRPRGRLHDPLSAFSGGNQQKVLVAKWLRTDPSVILLDEPTQGVDVRSKATIYQALIDAAASGRAVVISSSDVDELAALCHRVMVMRDGRVVQQLEGAAVTAAGIGRSVLGHDLEVEAT